MHDGGQSGITSWQAVRYVGGVQLSQRGKTVFNTSSAGLPVIVGFRFLVVVVLAGLVFLDVTLRVNLVSGEVTLGRTVVLWVF